MGMGLMRQQAASVFLVCALVMGASPVLGAAPANLDGNQQVASLWNQGCNAVVRGDFGQATDLLSKALESNPREGKVKKIGRREVRLQTESKSSQAKETPRSPAKLLRKNRSER